MHADWLHVQYLYTYACIFDIDICLYICHTFEYIHMFEFLCVIIRYTFYLPKNVTLADLKPFGLTWLWRL